MGDKLKMVKVGDRMVPSFAADGKGAKDLKKGAKKTMMAKRGGAVKPMKRGGAVKKKIKKKKNRVMKRGGGMMKPKMMGGGIMKKRMKRGGRAK